MNRSRNFVILVQEWTSGVHRNRYEQDGCVVQGQIKRYTYCPTAPLPENNPANPSSPHYNSHVGNANSVDYLDFGYRLYRAIHDGRGIIPHSKYTR